MLRGQKEIFLLIYADIHVNLPIVFKNEIPAPKVKFACTCKIHNTIVARHVAGQATLSLKWLQTQKTGFLTTRPKYIYDW